MEHDPTIGAAVLLAVFVVGGGIALAVRLARRRSRGRVGRRS
jgi:hypothetical protein